MVRGRDRGRVKVGGGRVSSECVTVLKGVVAEQLIIMLGPRGVAYVGRREDVHVDNQVRIQLLEGYLVRVKVGLEVRGLGLQSSRD